MEQWMEEWKTVLSYTALLLKVYNCCTEESQALCSIWLSSIDLTAAKHFDI